MVHPFSSSLFTLSLFHTVGYDLPPQSLTIPEPLNDALIVIEADDLVPSLDPPERNADYLTVTDREAHTDRIVMSSSETDNKTSQEPQTPLCPDWLKEDAPPLDNSAWNKVENNLGEVGVESHMIVPPEMLWSMAPASEPGLS